MKDTDTKILPSKLVYAPKLNGILFDCETDTIDNELVLRLGYYMRILNNKCVEQDFFYDKDDFTKIILNNVGSNGSRRTYVWAHNTGFDFRVGINPSIFKNADFSLSTVSTNPFIVAYSLPMKDIKNNDITNTIMFLDSFNFFKTSIEKLGGFFGVKKILIDFDQYEKDNKRIPEKLLKDRCQNDVFVLYKLLLALYEQMPNRVKFSSAQLSYSTFKCHLPYAINKINTDLASTSYHGGRVEVFKKDKANVTKYDVNCLDENTIIENKKLKNIRVGDTVNFQKVIDINNFVVTEITEIKLSNGNKILCTDNHRFKVKRGLFETRFIRKTDKFIVKDWKKTLHKPIFVLFGLLFADGYISINNRVKYFDKKRKQYRFSIHNSLHFDCDNNEKEFKEYVIKTMDLLFDNPKYKIYSRKNTRKLSIRYHTKKFVQLFYNSYIHFLNYPDYYNNLCKQSFLKGFMEGDGSPNIARGTISFSQSNISKFFFIKTIFNMLNFNISFNKVKFKGKYSNNNIVDATKYVSEIKISDIEKYMKKISFISKYKRSKIYAKIISKKILYGKYRVIDITLNGNKLYYGNDILTHNSMYPNVMLNNSYPVELLKEGYLTNTSSQVIQRHLDDGYGCIADVTLNVPESEYIPLAPYLRPTDKKLIFPVGKFRTILCNPELNLDHIEKIHKVEFYKMGKIFENFVNKYYPLKEKSKGFMREFYKVGILNSCYGKFGQKFVKTERFKQYDERMQYGQLSLENLDHKVSLLKFLDGQCFKNISYGRKNSVAIASFVCSYARSDLYNYLKMFAKHLYYCDTDCFVLPDNIKLPVSDKLGGLKIEAKGIAQFYTPKIYYFMKGKTKDMKLKGIPRTWEHKMNDQEIFAEGTRFTNFSESINKYGFQVKRVKENKTVKLIDTKRIWNGDKSTPLILTA